MAMSVQRIKMYEAGGEELGWPEMAFWFMSSLVPPGTFVVIYLLTR